MKSFIRPTGQCRKLTLAHSDLNILHLTAIADHKGEAVQATAGTAICSSQEQMSKICSHRRAAGVCSTGGIFSTSPSMLLHVFIFAKPPICAQNDCFFECHKAITSDFLICSFKGLLHEEPRLWARGLNCASRDCYTSGLQDLKSISKTKKPHEKASKNSMTFKWKDYQ